MQSVDGALFFTNDDQVLFKIQLADFLIPGPLLYSASSDCVMVANSNLEIECYNYQSMKAFTNNDLEQQKEKQIQEAKKAKMEAKWVTCIGESARQMELHINRYTKQCDVVVLGEQSLFILTEHGGQIRYQRRFHFSPSYFLPYSLKTMGADIYVAPSEDRSVVIDNALTKDFDKGGLMTPGFMTLLASFEGYLMVYKDIKLAWTVKMQTPPVFVNTARF